jgi:hypothetical protein
MQQKIDSYNGILLCKRPLSVAAPVFQRRGNVQNADVDLPATVSKTSDGNKPDHVFWKPSGGSTRNSERTRVIKRLNKNDGALRRHKQWLKQIQEQKKEMQKRGEEETKLKEEKRQEFYARQAKKRARAIESIDENDEYNLDLHESTVNDDAMIVMTKEHSQMTNTACRPAWSLTSTEAEVKQEHAQSQEEKDLIDFVDQLDFDSFYDDLELKILMTQVKDRIRILEKEKNKDEAKLRTILEVRLVSE